MATPPAHSQALLVNASPTRPATTPALKAHSTHSTLLPAQHHRTPHASATTPRYQPQHSAPTPLELSTTYTQRRDAIPITALDSVWELGGNSQRTHYVNLSPGHFFIKFSGKTTIQCLHCRHKASTKYCEPASLATELSIS